MVGSGSLRIFVIAELFVPSFVTVKLSGLTSFRSKFVLFEISSLTVTVVPMGTFGIVIVSPSLIVSLPLSAVPETVPLVYSKS